MRPWVLRALIMTLLHGVAQTIFVVLATRFVDVATLWSALLLGLVVVVGIVWAGAEVVADRIPEEWTWTKAALAAAPGAGLLNWILLGAFVDATGVADLGPALIGRASFTFLVILGSAAVGARLGWLALGRQGDARADRDPAADVDEPSTETRDPATALAGSAAPPVLPADTTERVAARRARRREETAASGDTGPGERPAVEQTPATARVPFGAGPFAERPSPTPPPRPVPARGDDGYASPVVAVLPPVTPLPSQTPAAGSSDGPADDESGSDSAAPRATGSRRRFGLRRPDDD